MKAVGIRELKNRLSEYVRQARSGEPVLIPDRGQVVAELNAPGRASAFQSGPPALVALAARGLLTLGGRNTPDLYPRLPRGLVSRRSSQLLTDERGTR